MINKLGKYFKTIFSGFLLFVVSCSHFIHSEKPKTALKGLENVKSYAVVYSKLPVTSYTQFDLLILEGDNYSKSEIRKLKDSDKIVLAYINVGEIETYRSYFDQVNSDWYLGKNENWPDHYFVDPSKKGWRNLLKKEVIPPLLEKGFQGFLFDSVDLASQSRFPEYFSAMAELIKNLHKSFPQAIIILNNGEFLLEAVANSVHGILKEEVFTERINKDLTKMRTEENSTPIIKSLIQAKNKWNIPIFILEYFPTDQSFTKKDIFFKSQKFGLIPYITDQYAQRIYENYLQFKTEHRRREKWSN